MPEKAKPAAGEQRAIKVDTCNVDHSSDLNRRLKSDSTLLYQLLGRLKEELTPLLHQAGLYIKAQDYLNVKHIINMTDRLIAVEGSRFYFLNNDGCMVPLIASDLSGTKAKGFFEQDSELINDYEFRKKLPNYDERYTLINKLRAKVIEIMLSYVRGYRYAASMRRHVDMFTDKASLTIDKHQIATLTQPHTPLVDLIPSCEALKHAQRVKIDFRFHFPEFGDFIVMLIAARFAPDRRKAFLWLNCPAGFGKGFLTSALKRLGLVVEMSEKDIEAALEGRPVGMDPDEVARAWVIVLDELKRTKSELKQLNNQITMAPKFQRRTTVEVFMKLVTTAEGIDSLAGEHGVESQFIDRFSYMNPSGKLENRKLFQEIGAHQYLTALSYVLAEEFDIGVNRMRELGSDEAYKDAEKLLNRLHSDYRIDHEMGSLSDSINEYANRLKMMIRQAGRWKQCGNSVAPSDLRDSLSLSLQQQLKSAVSVVYLGKGKEKYLTTCSLNQPPL